MLRVVTICLLLICASSWAQDVLSRKVQIDIHNETLDEAIDQLSDVAQFDYSYRKGVLQTDKIVSISSLDKSVEEILNVLIADKAVEYEVSGSQIIFVQKKEVIVRRTHNMLTGYVRDATTGEPIISAFIVDSTLRIAAETDANGYYELLVPNPDYTLGLHCIAEDYENKNLNLRLNSDKELNVKLETEEWDYIEPVTFKKQSAFIDVEDRKLVQIVLPVDTTRKSTFLEKLNLESVDLQLKDTKFGLLPVLSTDLGKDALSVNKLSINALAGYSAGTEGFEISGLMNINRFNVKGVQIAGIGNNVGGSVEGLQIGGFYNFNGLETKGTQIAGFANLCKLGFEGAQISGFVNANNGNGLGGQVSGFANINNGSMDGAQVTGFTNINNGEMTGIQGSGFVNFNNGFIDGTQLAGFVNMSSGRMKGIQGSGFVNYAKGRVDGSQVAGFINYGAGTINGFQVAGFTNLSSGTYSGAQISGFTNLHFGEFYGTQVSGFLNYTKTLRKGAIIAPFNVCDTIESGVAIGFLSIVKHGLHKLEIEHASDNITNLNFKTGTPKFYNILSYGRNFVDNFGHVGYGVGFMTFVGQKKKIHIDSDFDWHNRFKNGRFLLDQTVRYKPTVSVPLFKGVELFAGGAINFRYWRENHHELVANGEPLPALDKKLFFTYLAGIRF